MSLQSDRNGDGDQANGQRQVHQLQVVLGSVIGRPWPRCIQAYVNCRQRQREPCHCSRADFGDHRVGLQEVSHSVDERQRQRHHSRALFLAKHEQRGSGVDSKENGRKAQSRLKLAAVIEGKVPEEIVGKGSAKSHPEQATPGLECDESQYSEVEEYHVTEQRYLAILAGREQSGSGKAAADREHGKNLRVLS